MKSQITSCSNRSAPWMAACILIVLAVGGCHTQTAPAPNRYPSGIITPLPADPNQVSICQNLDQQKPGPRDQVQDIVLGSVVSLRDFKKTPGPDGYVISVSPINPKHQSKPVPSARLTICLYPYPQQGHSLDPADMLRMWQLEPGELARFWARSRLLDGYLLFLDWDSQPALAGNCLLAVVMDYRQGKTRRQLCRYLSLAPDRSFTLSQE